VLLDWFLCNPKPTLRRTASREDWETPANNSPISFVFFFCLNLFLAVL